MAAQGSVIARVFTSDAFLPLSDVPVVFTQTTKTEGRQLVAIRYTDSSGLTAPLLIETPDTIQSLSPGASQRPFTTVDIQVEYPGYGGILAEGVQVFPNSETIQGLQLRPIPTTFAEYGTVKIPGSYQNL